MFVRSVSGAFSVLVWASAALGVVVLVLVAMIARPLVHPPELQSISAARGTVDFATLPPVTRFQARDGTALGFRHYPAEDAASGRVAIVVHGSSGSSGGTIHALSVALAKRGVATFAVDIRGHGVSGTRGDIGYVGQLEDDLPDLVALVRKTYPTTPLTLIGHSSGGGFALRIAGSPIQKLFSRTVLVAPYLGWDAPTSRPDSGGWANADLPRILGLLALRSVGITCCESLPVLAFAVPPNSEKNLTATYTDRLMRNFAVSTDFRRDLAAATNPIVLISGANDELMFSEKYQDTMGDRASVTLIEGINHMGIVSDPRAVAIIAEQVATAEAGS